MASPVVDSYNIVDAGYPHSTPASSLVVGESRKVDTVVVMGEAGRSMMLLIAVFVWRGWNSTKLSLRRGWTASTKTREFNDDDEGGRDARLGPARPSA